MSSGRVTVNCGRATRANGGALGSQDRKDGILHLQSPKSWLPCWLWHSLGNHLQTDAIPTANFPYFFGGRSLRRLEGAGIELSSVQLVHKFAGTLSNTMIHKQFKNDKKGFGKFGPLAEGRGVSSLGVTVAYRTEKAQIPNSAGESAGKSAGKRRTARGLPVSSLLGIWAFSVLWQVTVIPILVFVRVWPFKVHAPYTLSTDDLGHFSRSNDFRGKPSILEVGKSML